MVKQRHNKIPKNVKKSSHFAEVQQLLASFLAQVEYADKDIEAKM